MKTKYKLRNKNFLNKAFFYTFKNRKDKLTASSTNFASDHVIQGKSLVSKICKNRLNTSMPKDYTLHIVSQ